MTNNETYNILNQGSGKTYDANGNMTRNGDDWIALYDGENRLRTVSHPYDGVELLYDYAGRIYQVNDFYMDGVDLPTSTLNYRRIYDGTKLIATVRNGAIEDTFVWQPETSGDADVILWDNSYVYATDPNKNVRVKRFPDEWMGSGWIEEFFDYKPFGELRHYVQYPPRFMFSSEEYMPETGMYHYLYRAYSPSLARFITRDPIEEQGGANLYCFVGNNPIIRWDENGLAWILIGGLAAITIITGIAIYSDPGTKDLTADQQKQVDRYINALKYCASYCGKTELISYLDDLNIAGIFADKSKQIEKEDSTYSETRHNFMYLGTRTFLRADFFDATVTDHERLSAIIHEAYHAGSGDFSEKHSYNFTSDILYKFKDCLEKELKQP